ncbi:MAG: hypothetical protein V4754_22135 [Pseudomonadota bacterium]
MGTIKNSVLQRARFQQTLLIAAFLAAALLNVARLNVTLVMKTMALDIIFRLAASRTDATAQSESKRMHGRVLAIIQIRKNKGKPALIAEFASQATLAVPEGGK